MPETTRADETRNDERAACALHALRYAGGQRADDDDADRECATCAEIARLIATGEVPF